MPLHKRYDMVRLLLDGCFQGYRRRLRDKGLEMDVDELWHDLMEAALEADREWTGDTGPDWEQAILRHVETRVQAM